MIIGIVQEIRCKKALEKMKLVTESHSLVIRNSKEATEICINVIIKDQNGNYQSYLLGNEFLISLDEKCLIVREL